MQFETNITNNVLDQCADINLTPELNSTTLYNSVFRFFIDMMYFMLNQNSSRVNV